MEDSFTFQCYGYLKGKCSHNSYVQEDALTSAILQALNQVTAYSKVQYEIRQADKRKRIPSRPASLRPSCRNCPRRNSGQRKPTWMG